MVYWKAASGASTGGEPRWFESQLAHRAEQQRPGGFVPSRADDDARPSILESILRFAILMLLTALFAPAVSAQELRLDGVLVLNPPELSRQPPAPPDGPVPSPGDVDARRRWSAPRLALGAAVTAAGVWYAISERRCRLRGSLNDDGPSPMTPGRGTLSIRPSHAPGALASLQIAYGGARSARTAWTGSGCSLAWQYTSEEFWTVRVGDRLLGPASYADVDPDAVRRWSTTDSTAQGDHPPASPEALAAMRGTIETEDYLPPSRLYSGIGIAAAGAVVALFFSRVDVPDWVDVDAAPQGASLSVRIGF